ncbi:protein L [Rhizobium sp. rho-13.1]|nr:protein L [Rhizobium sp. rho-13.1]
MALYVDETNVKKANPSDAFTKDWKPGTTPDYAGIYRCKGCGDEIASNKGVQLPSQNHRQHSPAQGAIRWHLLVATQPT